MSYSKTKIFGDIGKGIKKYNALDGYKTALDTILSEWVALLNDTEGERVLLNAAGIQNADDQATLDGEMTAVVDILESFLLDEIRSDLVVPEEDIDEILDALEDAMNAASPPDTVLQNTVSATVPVADADNTGNGTMGAVSTNQQVHDDCDFVIECYNIDTPGSELWYVSNNLEEEFDAVTTGVAFTNTKYGIGFTITAGGVDFAVGDRFTFQTSISVKSKFQTLFVTQWDKALPSAGAGLNTVDEALAT